MSSSGQASPLSVAILVSHDSRGRLRETTTAAKRALASLDLSGTVVACITSGDTELDLADTDVAIVKGGFQDALNDLHAEYVITLSSGEPDSFGRLVGLLAERDQADIVIASRTSVDRGTRPKNVAFELDRLMNRLIARVLTLEAVDLRSSTRLYRRAVLDDLLSAGCDLDDSIGLVVNATVRGWKIREIERPFWPMPSVDPLTPRPRLRTLGRYWASRNGIHDADYDMRAFNSRIPIQRKWQQRRQELTLDLMRPFLGGRVLNAGCGSARLNLELPGAMCVDVVQPKLRFLSRYKMNHFAAASVYQLPFRDQQFDCIVCAEVIEHIPREGRPIAELVRVLRPTGRLVISTPDYGTPIWPAIERVYGWVQPGGYADEHVTHYTERSLKEELTTYGFRCVATRKLYGAVLIAAFERVDDSAR